MKLVYLRVFHARLAALIAGCGMSLSPHAFPPAPHHLVFGMVRNEQGNPLALPGAEILLEVDGAVLARSVITLPEGGVNYELPVALDSGATADLYKPTALRPMSPFRMRVRIAGVTYLPIEMAGISKLTTKAGETTRVDLTLGEDSDGDGLPDAWERNVIAATGRNRSLADIRPGDDTDKDGISNFQEYLAGTYAFDPKDGFSLKLAQFEGTYSVLEFVALPGRTYTVLGSSDLQQWMPISFRLPNEDLSRSSFQATSVTLIRASVSGSTANSSDRFFKLMVQ